jgi:glutamate-1-semialdehyde 2,1-aminomutase
MTRQRNILLVFDEVITGMRIAPGGAQEYYSTSADITILSKALGSGFPIAAFGGSQAVMELIAEGSLFHGGVYSSNALVMSAAEAVLEDVMAHGEVMYARLHAVTGELAEGIREIFARLGISHVVQHVGPMLSMFLTRCDVEKLSDYRDVRTMCDFKRYIDLQHQMQRTGVYFHPNQFEPMFLSTAHTSSDVAMVLERIEDAARCCLAG